MSSSSLQLAFLYMPDISGFTQFVNETEIEHSTHIIQELLEIIISANQLNMELMEIEGDAVFFYRFGKTPSLKEIIEQSKIIFKNFHEHLLKYEHQRICQCGACRTANNLTLKFIVHSGTVSSYYVRDRFKLIGKDIIILHRLLKNKIPSNEYLLLTESLFELFNNEYLEKHQLSALKETEEFDTALINYKYIPTKQWLNEIVHPDENGNEKVPNMVPAVSINKEIKAPSDIVFNYIANLSKRAEWMKGIKNIEVVSGEKINQAGTIHKCIVENNNILLFKTNYFEHTDDGYSIIETDSTNESFAQQFTVEKISPDSCMVNLQFLVKNHLVSKTMFSFFMKNRTKINFTKSLETLKIRFEK